MDKRIAILGIIVEEMESVMAVNDLLHEYREYIIGRMGMPYREKNLSVISVVLDAQNEVIRDAKWSEFQSRVFKKISAWRL